MPTLVPIPWQPNYFLTFDTLTMLQLASAHAGHNIQVNDAWRSYAEQKSYWDAYQRYLHGGPYAAIASNPDTGQRNHMRGAAVDIANRADRGAMLAVGFTPDPDEWWHFNNPRWASMPIIPTNDQTIVSAVGVKPLPVSEEDDLKYELVSDTSDGIYVLSPQGVSAIPNATVQLPLFQRLVAGERTFTSAEWKAIDETLNRRL